MKKIKKIEKDVQYFSKKKYLFNITTGKNKKIVSLNDQKPENETLITIGKTAVIITENIGGKQIPLLVREWNKIDTMDVNWGIPLKMTEYKDSKGYIWNFGVAKKSMLNRMMMMQVKDDKGKKIYDMTLG